MPKVFWQNALLTFPRATLSGGEELRRKFQLAALSVAAAIMLAAASAAAMGENGHAEAEAKLQRALDLVGRGRLDDAIGEVDNLVARYPNFRLAHLVKGDLLLARTRPIRDLGGAAPPTERLNELRAELAVRMRDARDRPPAGHVPRYLLRLDRAQKHAIVADTGRARVYVYENANGTPRLIRDYYSTIGKHGFLKEREGDK